MRFIACFEQSRREVCEPSRREVTHSLFNMHMVAELIISIGEIATPDKKKQFKKERIDA